MQGIRWTVVTLITSVLFVDVGSPNLALEATTLVRIEHVSASSLSSARTLVASLAQSANLGPSLRVKSFSTSDRCDHSIMWAVVPLRAWCARVASFSAIYRVCSACSVESTRWASNRLGDMFDAVVAGWAVYAVSLSCAARGRSVGACLARGVTVVLCVGLTEVAWRTISHAVGPWGTVVPSVASCALVGCR